MRRRGHDGFTLVELLVTVVIMGTAFVVLVGGTLTGVIASNTHREKADGEIVLRRFIDEVKRAQPFDECPLDNTDYVPNNPDWANGFSLRIDYCQTIPPGGSGLQKLKLVVDPLNGQNEPDLNARQAVEIVKREPGNP